MTTTNGTAKTVTPSILVDVSISQWRSTKKDKKITDSTIRRLKTTTKAGNFNKNLLPFESETFSKLQAAINDLREFHRTNTTRWTEEGGLRVLPSTNYMPYMDGIRERRAAIDAAAEVFFNEFPKLVERAKQELGEDAFNPADYPSLPVLRSKFRVSVKTFPMPKPEHFDDAAIPDGQVEEMREQLLKELQESQETAVRDLAERLQETIGHVSEILGDKSKRRVHQSLFSNVIAVCEVLPRLTKNEDLIQIAKDAQAKLGDVDRNFVAKSKRVRKQVANDADAILKRMESYRKAS